MVVFTIPKIFDHLFIEPGAFYIFDRGYSDYAQLFHIQQQRAWFVTRARSNAVVQRVCSYASEDTLEIVADEGVVFTSTHSSIRYPDQLRQIEWHDTEQNRVLVFWTNHTTLSAITIAELYKSRWQIELFFKWIKQHLRIKAFFGTSKNAVKTQIWIAITTYLMVAILKKRLDLDQSLYMILQVLSISLFEKEPIKQLLTKIIEDEKITLDDKQLKLFE